MEQELKARNEPTDFHFAFAVEGLFGVSGGAERVLADVTRQLYLRGHRITVITYEGRNGPSFYPLEFGISRVDARPRHARRKKPPPFAKAARLTNKSMIAAIPVWLIQVLPKIFHLRRALKRVKPDVVVSFMPSMFPYMTLAAQATGVRTVASIHNVPRREFGSDRRRWNQNRFDIRVRRFSLRLADAITVLLPSFKDQLTRPSVRAKAIDIPNMVLPNDGPFANVETADEGNTILAVGRLADAKDHQSLIEAWANIESKYPNWRVKIFGNGPLQDSLRRRIRLLGIKRLTIERPTQNIMAEYRAARFLAMPSRYEGFGMVTAEALSCGLPVVGFANCEGTNELIKHRENGLLVNPRGGRAKAFEKGLEELITEQELRKTLAKNGPGSVERFTPTVVVDQWEQLLIALAKRRND